MFAKTDIPDFFLEQLLVGLSLAQSRKTVLYKMVKQYLFAHIRLCKLKISHGKSFLSILLV